MSTIGEYLSGWRRASRSKMSSALRVVVAGRGSVAASGLLYALIHPSAQKGNSANFAVRLYEKWSSGGDPLL